MKKKLVSLTLALVMCLSLSAPAFAEELNYTKSDLRSMYQIYRDFKSSISGLDYWVDESITLAALDDEGDVEEESLEEKTGYFAFGREDRFCLKNLGKEGTTLMGNIYVYTKSQDGLYIWTGETYQLRTNGRLVSSSLEENDENGYVLSLKPGKKSPYFSLNSIDTGLGTDNGDQAFLYRLYARLRFNNDGDDKDWFANSRCYMLDPASVDRVNGRGSAAKAFTDVKNDSPYAKGIRWTVQQGIANGKSATLFAPNEVCTVSSTLTFLWRASGRPGGGNDEQAAVIAWANELGIDTSNLSVPCTRATAVTCMWKAAGSPAPVKTATFSDVPADAGYAQAVSWAVGQEITAGTSASAFSPGSSCTRGQIATFIYRAYS